VSWGGTSLDAVERAFEQLLLGSNLSQDREKLKSPEIRMVVGTLDLRQSIDLKKTSKIIKKSRYRPHVFPGLLWKNNSQIALIFSSGKIVITGSKSKEELDKMAEELVRLFQ
jgi:TATA-box binding protein (TBP) (component of TFIID and TFIIIB)